MPTSGGCAILRLSVAASATFQACFRSTHLSMSSIETLLSAQRTTLLKPEAGASKFGDMLETWQRLWKDFGAFVDIRDSLICGRQFFPNNMVAAGLLEHLVEVGLLTNGDGFYRVADRWADRKLRGAWLEELGASVALSAGADEVLCSQKISWLSRYDQKPYFNEVDVLARFGLRLAFVSCKALAPASTTKGNGPDRLFDAMKEVAYWRQHFGAGQGHAILLTTADFIDEVQHRYRNPALTEHAAILNVDLVSADAGDFEGLVSALKQAVLVASQLEA